MNWDRIEGSWKQIAEWQRKATDAWFLPAQRVAALEAAPIDRTTAQRHGS